MATNHNRTLYNDYIAALLGIESAEEQVRVLNARCRKLERYAASLAEENDRKEDNILPLLPPETRVMHDHNIVNYCSDYSFTNIECNAHLLRDLQKVYDLTQYPWAAEAKKLIQTQIHKRNHLAAQGIEGFSEEEVSEFFTSLYALVYQGTEDVQNTPRPTWKPAREMA